MAAALVLLAQRLGALIIGRRDLRRRKAQRKATRATESADTIFIVKRLVPSGIVVLLAAGQIALAQPASSLEEAAKAAAQLPRLRSLLVSWRGSLILERYYGGARATQPANIKSASKSVISALVGIAVSKGLIKTVDQRIVEFFPELAKDPEPKKRDITIEDLITMRSGLESTSGREYGAWVQSRNWVRYVLAQPLTDEPGTRVEYSTGTSHLLSAILTKATKKSTWQFAQEELAKPLGFSLAQWPQDPQGIYFGGNDMLMTPRQMIRFGELYENGGRIGDRQVIPKSWIDQTGVAARALAMGQRSRVRLRILDSRVRGQEVLLRVGLRGTVHLHRPGPGPRGRDHVAFRRVARSAGPQRRDLPTGRNADRPGRSVKSSDGAIVPRCHGSRCLERNGTLEPWNRSGA